jgi:hypothetical protein
VSKGQPSQESTPSGIGDWRIRDPENVSSKHFKIAKSETPIPKASVGKMYPVDT